MRRYSKQPLLTVTVQIARLERRPPDEPAVSHRLSRRLGASRLTQLCADYEAGASARQLAANYHISKTSVQRILQARGIPLRRQGLTPDQLRGATELYQAGKSIPEVAAAMALSQNIVYYALKRAGVAMRWGRH